MLVTHCRSSDEKGASAAFHDAVTCRASLERNGVLEHVKRFFRYDTGIPGPPTSYWSTLAVLKMRPIFVLAVAAVLLCLTAQGAAAVVVGTCMLRDLDQ
jgi:hypothetical protein